MKNTKLLIVFICSLFFMSTSFTNVQEEETPKVLFGDLSTGTYRLEEINKQNEVKILIDGNELENEDFTIVYYKLLHVPIDTEKARLIVVSGAPITDKTREYYSNLTSGERIILTDVTYKIGDNKAVKCEDQVVLTVE